MGMLIAIEGISGSGKSSFAKKLCNLLFKYGIPHSSYGGFNISEQSTELTKFCNYIVTHERFLGFPIISETHLLLAEIVPLPFFRARAQWLTVQAKRSQPS